MFLNGHIEESSFDSANVELDRDTKNNIVSRDFGIQKENCHPRQHKFFFAKN